MCADIVAGAHVNVVFEAIGTRWEIDLYDCAEAKAQRLLTAVKRRIAEFDQQYSRFRPDSLVTRMAERAGTYRLPPDAQPLFDLYRELYGLTDGAFTPLIGRLLSDAGYDAQYSLRPGKLRRPPAWDEALQYNFPDLTVMRPVLLDVGAAGKGYAVDIVSAMLHDAGVRTFCVDAGGDIVQRSMLAEQLDVGLEHPDHPGQVIGVVHIANQSLCGSAGNRRAWGEFHHIINPHTLASPRHIKAAWVVAGTALVADALTTCLFFVPAQTLAARYTFEYALVHSDLSLEHSAHFPATFFTT